MKNITLAVDDTILDEVWIYAAKRNTSVDALVREFLNGIAEQEDKTVRAHRRLRELMDRTTLEVGPVTWSRAELHDR